MSSEGELIIAFTKQNFKTYMAISKEIHDKPEAGSDYGLAAVKPGEHHCHYESWKDASSL